MKCEILFCIHLFHQLSLSHGYNKENMVTENICIMYSVDCFSAVLSYFLLSVHTVTVINIFLPMYSVNPSYSYFMSCHT
jgi:hypothetical protein